MPSHLTWITLRVIHIPTTTAATDFASHLNPKPKTEQKILQKVLDTTVTRIFAVRDVPRLCD